MYSEMFVTFSNRSYIWRKWSG